MLDGVFHADPHPGNVLLLADGAAGAARLRLGRPARRHAAGRAAAAAAGDRPGDPVAVSDALLEVVPRPDEIDQPRLERAVGVVLARHLGPGAAAGLRLFADLVRVVAGFGLAVPPEVAAVFRALATVEGTLTQLAPGFDLVAEARAVRRRPARRAAGGRVAAPAGHRRAGHAAADAAPAAAPGGPDRRRGRGRPADVNVRLFADERDRAYATGLVQQLLLTVLGATAGLMAVLLLGTAGGPRSARRSRLYQLLGYFLLVISSVLVLRVLVLIFRRERHLTALTGEPPGASDGGRRAGPEPWGDRDHASGLLAVAAAAEWVGSEALTSPPSGSCGPWWRPWGWPPCCSGPGWSCAGGGPRPRGP